MKGTVRDLECGAGDGPVWGCVIVGVLVLRGVRLLSRPCSSEGSRRMRLPDLKTIGT